MPDADTGSPRPFPDVVDPRSPEQRQKDAESIQEQVDC